METVKEYGDVAPELLALEPASEYGSYNIVYNKQGPLLIAYDATPVVANIRADGVYIGVTPEMVETFQRIAASLANSIDCLYSPVGEMYRLTPDVKVYDRACKELTLEYKQGYYRVMFAFVTATVRNGVLTAVPQIKQMQLIEDVKEPGCYWLPTIKVNKRKMLPMGDSTAMTSTTEPPAERKVRKSRLSRKVEKAAGDELEPGKDVPQA
jgi:hypothetical protein